MTEGFNPRQKIAVLLARGVGIASDAEYAEIELTDWVSASDVQRRLNGQLPVGLHVEDARLSDTRRTHRVIGIDYRVTCGGARKTNPEDVRELLAKEALWVERRRGGRRGSHESRRIDIRPFIRDASADGQGLRLSLEVSDKGTTRPEEVLAALGVDPGDVLADCLITRTAMRLSPSL